MGLIIVVPIAFLPIIKLWVQFPRNSLKNKERKRQFLITGTSRSRMIGRVVSFFAVFIFTFELLCNQEKAIAAPYVMGHLINLHFNVTKVGMKKMGLKFNKMVTIDALFLEPMATDPKKKNNYSNKQNVTLPLIKLQ